MKLLPFHPTVSLKQLSQTWCRATPQARPTHKKVASHLLWQTPTRKWKTGHKCKKNVRTHLQGVHIHGYETSSCLRFIPNKDYQTLSNTDQIRNGGILHFHPSPSQWRGKTMHMPNYDVVNDKEYIGLSAVHDIAKSTDIEQDKSWIDTQELIHEYAKSLCCLQASSKVRLPGPTFNYDGNGFFGTQGTHRLSSTKSRPYVCTTMSFILLALAHIGKVPGWNADVRLNATQRLLATYIKWRVHDCERLLLLRPK